MIDFLSIKISPLSAFSAPIAILNSVLFPAPLGPNKDTKMPIIDYKKNFKSALKIMNQKKLGIVVITKNKFIKGLMTDGDLRREINNYSDGKKLNNFTKKYPMVVNENMPASKALGIMNEKRITSLLVVSDKDYIKANKKLQGIIHIHSVLQNGIR